MEDSGLGRRSARIAVLLCALVLLASAERRLAYLDFDTSSDVRIENNEKPDGDEIINRLVFVGDATEPILPGVGEACRAALASLPACSLGLVVVRLTESRGPPLASPSQA